MGVPMEFPGYRVGSTEFPMGLPWAPMGDLWGSLYGGQWAYMGLP